MAVQRQCSVCGDSYEGVDCPKCLGTKTVTEDSPLRLGQNFHGLEILEILGRGGMGIVYKAQQTNLDRLVALKTLLDAKPRHPNFEFRFEREAKALASLSHPGIVSVFDYGQEEETYFLVMEYVDGGSLRDRLLKGKLPVDETRDILQQVCDAVAFAHGEGIVHRDIKPENILIDKRGRVKLADFGLAKLETRTTKLTQAGAALGTAYYMAPEQDLDPKSVDQRAEIYSLGVVIHEMLTGGLPRRNFANPSEVVQKALEADPGQRYQSVAELKRALLPSLAQTQIAEKEKPAPKSRAWIPVLAVFLLLVGGIVIWWRWPRAEHGASREARTAHPEPNQKSLEVSFSDERTLEGHTANVHELVFSADSRLLYSGGADGVIGVWSIPQGEKVGMIEPLVGKLTSIALSPRGKLMAVGGGGYNLPVRFVRVSDGKFVGKIGAHEGTVFSVAFHPDGKQLVTGGGESESRVRVWSVSDGEERMKLKGHKGPVYSVRYGPHGKIIASGSGDTTIRLWDAAERKEIAVLRGHAAHVYGVRFRPGHDQLASVSRDRTVRLWDTSTHRVIRSFLGHTESVYSVAFSSDGSLMATASQDRTVRVWDPDSGRLLKVLLGFRNGVQTVAFSSDGRSLAAGTWGNLGDRAVIKLWRRD